VQHELISLLSTPTLPVAYSSRVLRRGLWMYHAEDYYAVIDQEPICMEQSMQLMSMGRLDRNYDMQYLYAASLFYKASRNPHGPSKRPIFVAALEHSRFSCQYEGPGLLGRLLGKRPRPTSVFLGMFTATGHENFGQHANRFTDDSAKSLLLDTVAGRVGLKPADFRPCADSSKGPECPEIR